MTEPSAEPAVEAGEEPARRGQRMRDWSAFIVMLACVIVGVLVVFHLTGQETSNVFSNVSNSGGP